jgi:hypothetical protein
MILSVSGGSCGPAAKIYIKITARRNKKIRKAAIISLPLV